MGDGALQCRGIDAPVTNRCHTQTGATLSELRLCSGSGFEEVSDEIDHCFAVDWF